MSLWLLLALVGVWIGLCVIVLSLSAMAARGDRKAHGDPAEARDSHRGRLRRPGWRCRRFKEAEERNDHEVRGG